MKPPSDVNASNIKEQLQILMDLMQAEPTRERAEAIAHRARSIMEYTSRENCEIPYQAFDLWKPGLLSALLTEHIGKVAQQGIMGGCTREINRDYHRRPELAEWPDASSSVPNTETPPDLPVVRVESTP